MSLTDRLFNAAKAELKDAAKKLKDATGELINDRPGADLNDDKLFEERLRAAGIDPNEKSSPEPRSHESPDIQRFYANLELPIGATLEEVKAAYRRLMRRYHPDRHHNDPQKAEMAKQLSQQLRVAYEGLLKHLDPEKK